LIAPPGQRLAELGFKRSEGDDNSSTGKGVTLPGKPLFPLFSIERLENGQTPPGELATALAAIQATLTAKGIEFSHEHGVLSVKLKSK